MSFNSHNLKKLSIVRNTTAPVKNNKDACYTGRKRKRRRRGWGGKHLTKIGHQMNRKQHLSRSLW